MHTTDCDTNDFHSPYNPQLGLPPNLPLLPRAHLRSIRAPSALLNFTPLPQLAYRLQAPAPPESFPIPSLKTLGSRQTSCFARNPTSSTMLSLKPPTRISRVRTGNTFWYGQHSRCLGRRVGQMSQHSASHDHAPYIPAYATDANLPRRMYATRLDRPTRAPKMRSPP